MLCVKLSISVGDFYRFGRDGQPLHGLVDYSGFLSDPECFSSFFMNVNCRSPLVCHVIPVCWLLVLKQRQDSKPASRFRRSSDIAFRLTATIVHDLPIPDACPSTPRRFSTNITIIRVLQCQQVFSDNFT